MKEKVTVCVRGESQCVCNAFVNGEINECDQVRRGGVVTVRQYLLFGYEKEREKSNKQNKYS